MSRESMEWLNRNTLIGYTSKRGNAWHYSEGHQGDESNHYPDAVPVDDVLRRLFNFHFESVPVTYNWHDQIMSAEGQNMIVASDNGQAMGIRGDSMPHDYQQWLLSNVATILDESQSDLHIGSAGLLKDRRQAWVQIESAESLSVAGFEYRPHLLAVTSADGSIVGQYRRAVTAVVCDNTLSAAMGEGGGTYKLRATKYARLNVMSARQALDIVFETGSAFEAEVNQLLEETVSTARFDKFVDAWQPLPKEQGRGYTMAETKRNALSTLYYQDERVSPWSGTAFGVLQAVNTYEHHEKIVRGASRAERNYERKVKGEFDTVDSDTLSLLATV